MSVARIRLVVAATLFLGWLGWLAYLAAFKTDPVIVSHSQMMASTRFVVAEVLLAPDTGQVNRKVKVVDDLRPVGPPLTGEINVSNLEKAEIVGGKRFRDGGHYLLALTPDPHGDGSTYELTRSPDRIYRPPGADRIEPGRPWVYPWENADVRKQFDSLVPKP